MRIESTHRTWEFTMAGKIVLVLGILGLLLGGATLIITIILLAGAGHVSGEEAMPGFIGGCFCSFVSLVIAVVGLVLVMKGRKPPTAPPTIGTPMP
jgi:membrane-bound ClpP family serine protease